MESHFSLKPVSPGDRPVAGRWFRACYSGRMANRIRIIKHELFRSKCGSFEVCFADGRASRFFHFDDVPSRRLRPDTLTSEQALEQAKAFAKAERDKEI
jgi:hypothetical protein